jgi:hypothetical protein
MQAKPSDDFAPDYGGCDEKSQAILMANPIEFSKDRGVSSPLTQ